MIYKVITPKYNDNGIFLRQIRSFVLRNKKLSASDIKAMQYIWPLIGENFQFKEINFYDFFYNSKPVILDIGFGTGDTLVNMAIKNPEKNFLGIEVHSVSVARCLRYAFLNRVKNLKIIYHDAVEVMNHMIKNSTVFSINLFFPDPWNKKRHYKRRIIKKHFIELILKKLIFHGTIHIVTDCAIYAKYIIEIIQNVQGFCNVSETKDYVSRPFWRPITKFEKKALIFKKNIFDICFKKNI